MGPWIIISGHHMGPNLNPSVIFGYQHSKHVPATRIMDRLIITISHGIRHNINPSLIFGYQHFKHCGYTTN